MNGTPTFPTRDELEEIKRLSKHVPGKVVTISLDNLPAYLAMHRLVPNGMTETGVLLVTPEKTSGAGKDEEQ